METTTIEIVDVQRNNTTVSGRLRRLHAAVEASHPSICAERAVLITEYFKKKENKEKPLVIQKAEALSYVLNRKSVKIYPDELIVGSTTSKRLAGPIYPELHGVAVLEDIFSFSTRNLNPLEITNAEKKALLKDVAPFWLTKFLAYKSFSMIELFGFVIDQLHPKFYLINETGGIGHFVPDYELLINLGLDGIIAKIKEQQKTLTADDTRNHLYNAMIIICEGVISMALKYADEAARMAEVEVDIVRKEELSQISKNLQNVPRKPASTFEEALQSVWMVHTALFLEGLDNGISFGRTDQYLYPFYTKDIETGVLTEQRAKELLGCFAVKSAEIIPVFSHAISECHGGFLSGQAMTIGGIDGDGKDVTNDLSYIILELMDEVRLRQPNYHARIHPGSPKRYVDKIVSNLLKGVNSPALFNDTVIIESLQKCGFSNQDAREYTTLGCVELGAPGKTFGSTDAALFNMPICLEMALNKGKLFNSMRMSGCKTADPETFKSIEDVKEAYLIQLQYKVDKLVGVLAPIELGNKKFHPTPFTSAMIDGCIEKGKDVTDGGAVYNFSGVQGVGITDVGDSLYAIHQLVFVKKKYTLVNLIKALKRNFDGNEKMRLDLLHADKFGNDISEVDQFSSWVANTFYSCFENKKNTRGGQFVAGYYSTTTHYSFGKYTAALPSGRKKGMPFSSGISPMNGADKKGPTALFNSITAIDYVRAHNGVNVNAKFDTATLKGEHGREILKSLMSTYFKKGGMQLQLNVLDTEMLKDAKLHPEKYTSLIVRVSGYSAYFNDLSPAMKDEIIQRSSLSC
ncbi:MAG: formate C-acetyltransferase/glycerol dehydratase family glycyl radical enzyme [Sphingobacteriales bacterium]|jgi:pyruvate formate-lyase/glycerol dehydratase family glycyl radical enzyme|nr:formate C-acetyltransferase/glycerol dehydratase family glycyl radical enzyme [Sphingobacteriales bacterium]